VDQLTNASAAITTVAGLAFTFGAIDARTTIIAIALTKIVSDWLTGKGIPTVGQIQNALDQNLRR
jgi:hypothetical protein